MAFFLPKLQSEQGINVKEDSAGAWNQLGIKAFEDVAASLEVPNMQAYVSSISSIPDIWARPMAFDMALHNRKHPLHQQMVEQWQGMLAAVALAETRNFRLRVQLLDLEQLKTEDAFARSLYELLPKFTHDLYQLGSEKSPWQEIYLFIWGEREGRAVGMGSPSTLVCPAEGGQWQGLPWFSGGRLRSPIAPVSHINDAERIQLWHWLDKLKAEIGQEQQVAKAQIRGLLEDFQRQLVDAQPNSNLALTEQSTFFKQQITHPILKALNKPIKAIPLPTSVKVLAHPSKTPARDLLIIPDPMQMLQQSGRSKQEIGIYETTTLETVGTADIRRWPVNCLLEKDVFLPEFYFVNRPNALPGSVMPKSLDYLGQVYDGKEITPLLPINPLLLDYLTPDYLTAKLEIQQGHNTATPSIEFVLELPLSGFGDGEVLNYRMTRTYPLKKENSFAEVPVLELWPNFRIEDWQEYHAFLYDPSLETFQVQFPSAIQTRNFKGMGSFHYPNYSFPDTDSNCMLAQLSAFPEFVECLNAKKERLGLILLKQPTQVNKVLRNTWRVGVDFGTSFTNVYIDRNGTFEQLKINPLHFQITDSNPEIQQPSLYEYFIASNMELPLSTVLSLRGPGTSNNSSTGGSNLSETGYPLSEGRILIPRDSSTFKPSEDFWIKTNLKWGSEADHFENCELFVKNLMLQVTAQAVINNVSEIKWAISYPSAFSKTEIKSYARNWSNWTSQLQQSTGVSHQFPGINDSNYYRTESLATAQFFADFEKPGVKRRLDLVKATCIDIGGGSSDISIWENNTLVHQCSVQLAGKDLFSQMMQMNPGFLERKFKVGQIEEWRNLQGFQFFVKLDVLMRRDSEGWLRNRRDSFEDDPEFQGLVQLMALGIAGLYYYVGLLLKTLHEEGKYSDPEITPVYVGGNGCRLLNWLATGGEFDPREEANDLFSDMLSLASGFENTKVATHLSSSPKDEVACGLVIGEQKGNQLKGLDRKSADNVIAGEACEINGVSTPWNSRLDFKDQINSFKITPLEQLPRFLKSFHDALETLDIDDIQPFEGYVSSEDTSQNRELWRDTERTLSAMLLKIRGNGEDVRPEPTFILALKALIETLGQRWADKWRRN
jgi:hypothetical protein